MSFLSPKRSRPNRAGTIPPSDVKSNAGEASGSAVVQNGSMAQKKRPVQAMVHEMVRLSLLLGDLMLLSGRSEYEVRPLC